MERVPDAPPLPRFFRLLGQAMRHGPARMTDAMLSRAAASISARHPQLLQRLAPFDGKVLTIVIEDVGAALDLRLGSPIALTLTGRSRRSGDAMVSGNWLALVAMLEGRVDGDALFFSRALSFQGETDLVLAIRNAIDGAGLDLVAEIAAVLGPGAPAFRRLAPAMLGSVMRAGRALDSLHAAALAPAMTRCDQLRAELDGLRSQSTASAGVPAGQARRRRPPAND